MATERKLARFLPTWGRYTNPRYIAPVHKSVEKKERYITLLGQPLKKFETLTANPGFLNTGGGRNLVTEVNNLLEKVTNLQN